MVEGEVMKAYLELEEHIKQQRLHMYDDDDEDDDEDDEFAADDDDDCIAASSSSWTRK